MFKIKWDNLIWTWVDNDVWVFYSGEHAQVLFQKSITEILESQIVSHFHTQSSSIAILGHLDTFGSGKEMRASRWPCSTSGIQYMLYMLQLLMEQRCPLRLCLWVWAVSNTHYTSVRASQSFHHLYTGHNKNNPSTARILCLLKAISELKQFLGEHMLCEVQTATPSTKMFSHTSKWIPFIYWR